MFYRALGKTGMVVSEVGLGGNRLGEGYATVEEWVHLIHQAVDMGVTLFDTAEAYGWGRSEEMLGLALGSRDDVVLATKMCRVRETSEQDYSAKRMIETVEGSLRRLRRDVIEIYQLHSPTRESLERYDWAEGMTQLKEQGKIRASAVAVNHAAEGIWLMEQNLVDVLQITYNLFETEADEGLFQMAEQRGVGLLCRMPLARGVLSGKWRAGDTVAEGHRALLDGDRLQENLVKADLLRPIADEYEGGMARLALHFSLTPVAISSIIPGARTLEQLAENVAASNGAGLDARWLSSVAAVRARW